MIARIFLSALISVTLLQCIEAQTPVNDWENPLLYEVNKEAPHASFMLYADRASVLKDDFTKSPFYQSLN
nr:hypothetical protein [Chitinophagaceae bacterium]